MQEYVEDCQVCCQPNALSVRFDPREQQFVISVKRES
jgi:Cysteine-rich CPXCG